MTNPLHQVDIDNLRRKPHVLSLRTDLTKITKDKDTGKPCITVFVDEKVDRALLTNRTAIPKVIRGVLTDVRVLSADDYEIGQTSVGLKTPEEQKRMMGLRRDA